MVEKKIMEEIENTEGKANSDNLIIVSISNENNLVVNVNEDRLTDEIVITVIKYLFNNILSKMILKK